MYFNKFLNEGMSKSKAKKANLSLNNLKIKNRILSYFLSDIQNVLNYKNWSGILNPINYIQKANSL